MLRSQNGKTVQPLWATIWPFFQMLNVAVSSGFPGGSDGKESACNAGGLGAIPGAGRRPGGGQDNPLQYCCLGNPQGQRSLVGYRPWGRKEVDTTERLSTSPALAYCFKRSLKVATD